MNQRLYVKLAWTGIKKNKELYHPCLVAGIAMVTVFYIFAFLASSDLVHSLRGGGAMTTLLVLGEIMVGIFSVPFLFYTSSALMKKRKKEFGLYNILGMNKKNILASLFWETLMAYVIVILIGCVLGIACSKAAELGLVNIMQEKTDYRVYVDWKAVLRTVFLYAGIYFLIFLHVTRQIQHHNPMELLRSASVGERPPKSRWLLSAAATGVLGVAYVLAATVKDNEQAVARLYIIAPLIVAGTYLLFVAGSVFFCKMLQKNKRYYYKPTHFITLSSLLYRMKRNGASLASICILATAVLVALTGTFGFYTGADGIVERHYPYDLGITLEAPKGMENNREIYDSYRLEIEGRMKETGAELEKIVETYAAATCVPLEDGVLDLSFDLVGNAPKDGNVKEWNRYLGGFAGVRVIGLEDYNRAVGVSEELGDREVLIACQDVTAGVLAVRSWDEQEYAVKKTVRGIPEFSTVKLDNGFLDEMQIKSFLLVVPSMEDFWKGYDASVWELRNEIRFFWEYDVNLKEDGKASLALRDSLESWAQETEAAQGSPVCNYYTRAEKYEKLKGLAGGVLFLAVVISAVFIFVATLILYYKQISEGYEDQKQFAIMRKIGMTKREIRRSINSQMFTVFGFPLIVAGIHLCFALPSIYRIMSDVVTDDKPLLIKVAVISFLIFTAAYTGVYLLTTRVYFRIVNRPLNG